MCALNKVQQGAMAILWNDMSHCSSSLPLRLIVHQEHFRLRWSEMMRMIGLLQSSLPFWRDVGFRQKYA